MTGLFEKPLAQGIYLQARRDTRRVYQHVKILCSALEVGWLIGFGGRGWCVPSIQLELSVPEGGVHGKSLCAEVRPRFTLSKAPHNTV